MYKYKHKRTGEVIETSNQVNSKNWDLVKKEKTEGGAGAKNEGKTAGAKTGVPKKTGGKNPAAKQDSGKAGDNK